MKKRSFIAALAAVLCCTGVKAGAVGWQGEPGNSKYIKADDTPATGVLIVDDTAYSFASDGTPVGRYTGMSAGRNGIKYYADGKTYTGGWLELPSGRYYFYPSGLAATGSASIDGKEYSFDEKGRLITASDRSAYVTTGDKSVVSIGAGEKLAVNIDAPSLSDSGVIGDNVSLQRFNGVSWVKHPKNTTLSPVILIEPEIGKLESGEYKSRAGLLFTPDLYSTKLKDGHYRLAIPVNTAGTTIWVYYEFDIVRNAVSNTDSATYDIRSTKKISFTTTLAKDEFIYPEVNELFFRANGKWEPVEPKSGREIVSETSLVKGGTEYTSYLDLERYDKTALKTGRYMVYIGDGVQSEFRLTNPVDAEAVQIEAQKAGNIKINITFHCRKYEEVSVTKYGELYYNNGRKWVKVEQKKSALPGDILLESGMVYDQQMLITDYYSAKELKSGKYAIKIYTSTGEYTFAYFDLEI